MKASYNEAEPAEWTVARFLQEYQKIWREYFPWLNKRTHWHILFAARRGAAEGISCRSIHRTLYGSYGTDIRTCIERIKDCEADGFVKLLDQSGRPCAASAASLFAATTKLRGSFDRHCQDTVEEVCAVFGERQRLPAINGDDTITSIFNFFTSYDQKWRETCEAIVRQKGLTPAHVHDAIDHLVTFQYWAIVMLLWSAGPFGTDRPKAPALVIDEINSRMWDVLRLGHLAIRERIANLIRWGFLAEQTIKKHKAAALTLAAGSEISKSLAETKPVLRDLYIKLDPQHARVVPIAS